MRGFMFELVTVLILGLMLLGLRKLRPLPAPEPPFYFKEEDDLPRAWGGRSGELSFYTVAEFNETQEISASGLQKHLGFSEFPLIYDCNSEKIKTARVKFIGADGYKRKAFIGLYKFLNNEKDWLEVLVHLSVKEYDSMFKELKEYSRNVDSAGRYFFLFNLSTATGVMATNGAAINLVTSISNVGIYPEADAHKIRAMICLREGLNDSDTKYRVLCEEAMRRFQELVASKYEA